MPKVKNKVSRRLYEDKERIGKFANIILIAFLLQFVFYLFLMNVIPIHKADTNGDGYYSALNGEVNNFFFELWDDRQNDGYKNYHINSIQFIHNYNLVLLLAVIILGIYYLILMLEEHEGNFKNTIKDFWKENKGLLLLALFILWTFIGAIFAGDTFRSFIGCHNLRDGFLSFMFYGSILVCMLLLTNINSKNEEKSEKLSKIIKTIVYLFLVVATLLALITIINYINPNFFIKVNKVFSQGYTSSSSYVSTIEGTGEKVVDSVFIPINDNDVRTSNYLSIVTSSVFNNSNHYAYFLSIAIIVAACMFVKEDNLVLKSFSIFGFVIMTYMLIINDTFGAYLGVGISLICMIIFSIIRYILNTKDNKKENNNNNNDNNSNKTGAIFEIFLPIIAMSLFVVVSLITKDSNGVNLVNRNFEYIGNSIKSIVASTDNSENSDENISNNEGENDLNINENTENNAENSNDNNGIDASDAGSGRWKLWVGALKIIFENPRNAILGVGPENMLFEYADIGINEGRSHNLILQLAGTTGIVGMLLYVIGIAFIFFKALRYIKYWDAFTYTGVFVMISYLISSLTGNSGFYTSGYFYIFVGLVVIGTANIRKHQKDKK